MQSIYRFREAEVGFFLQAWNDQGLLGDISLTPSDSTQFSVSSTRSRLAQRCLRNAFPKAVDAERRSKIQPCPAAKPGSAEEGVMVKAFPTPMMRARLKLSTDCSQRLGKGDESVAILVRSRTHSKRSAGAPARGAKLSSAGDRGSCWTSGRARLVRAYASLSAQF